MFIYHCILNQLFFLINKKNSIDKLFKDFSITNEHNSKTRRPRVAQAYRKVLIIQGVFLMMVKKLRDY